MYPAHVLLPTSKMYEHYFVFSYTYLNDLLDFLKIVIACYAPHNFSLYFEARNIKGFLRNFFFLKSCFSILRGRAQCSSASPNPLISGLEMTNSQSYLPVLKVASKSDFESEQNKQQKQQKHTVLNCLCKYCSERYDKQLLPKIPNKTCIGKCFHVSKWFYCFSSHC